MNALNYVCTCLLALGIALLAPPPRSLVQRRAAVRGASRQAEAAARDGQHDFDFEIGTWKTHVSRLEHPLSKSTTWATYAGTTVVRKVWHGRANLVELEADGPTGHLEGLSLRLYDGATRQWRLYYANSTDATVSQPAVGAFRNGRGQFFDHESFHGRPIYVRNVWVDFGPDSCRFEQAFSPDEGKTWEVNWIATDVRVKSDAGPGR